MPSITEKIVREPEVQAGSAKGEKAKALKGTVEKALAEAEATFARPEIIDRFDDLLVALTKASRGVCSNT